MQAQRAEQYKGVWIEAGRNMYAFQNPIVRNEAKGIINKMFQGGQTSARPTSASAQIGENYYDTDLGVPLWFDGTYWTSADGTNV